jgi:small conductance mechanosensitive channel
MDIQVFAQQVYGWLITTGLQVLVILGVTALALRLADMGISRLIAAVDRGKRDVEGEKRAATVESVLGYVTKIAVWLVAGLMILRAMDIAIGPILAAAGIVGVAVGFGAQSLVKDVIGGFFILLEDQVRVGDVVEVGGKAGFVERVNLRMTVLRDLSGNVHYVPNSSIDIVTNMTKEFSYYVFDIGVSYREDVDEVTEVMTEVGRELREDPEYADDILEDLEILGLDQFGDSAIVIKARFKTIPIKQWRVGREYNRRLKEAFDERDIEIPFPHVTVYMGEDKDGTAPLMNVRMTAEAENGADA